MNRSNTSAPLCQAPDSEIRSPKIAFPSGAVDCHAHVCGPATEFPYASERIYTPPDATLETYRLLINMLHVDRAVLVQPSVYGTDNRAMLAALKQYPEQFRGVAVISSNPNETTDKELESLHQAGVRGIRCNIVDVADPSAGLPIKNLKQLANKIKPFGWHLELLMHVNEYPSLAKIFEDFPNNFASVESKSRTKPLTSLVSLANLWTICMISIICKSIGLSSIRIISIASTTISTN